MSKNLENYVLVPGVQHGDHMDLAVISAAEFETREKYQKMSRGPRKAVLALAGKVFGLGPAAPLNTSVVACPKPNRSHDH